MRIRITLQCRAFAGGALSTTAAGAVYNCVINDCQVNTNQGSVFYAPSSLAISFTFYDCTISNITTGRVSFSGRGIYENCTFEYNTTSILASQTRNCLFKNNAVTAITSSGTHYGCVFVNNEFGVEGGNYYNCTFANNTEFGAKNSKLYNSISWDNGIADSECTYSYSCSTSAPGDQGNTSGNPNFSFTSDGIPVPTIPSACINSADKTHLPLLTDKDILGNKRIRGNSLDMGATEAVPPNTLMLFR